MHGPWERGTRTLERERPEIEPMREQEGGWEVGREGERKEGREEGRKGCCIIGCCICMEGRRETRDGTHGTAKGGSKEREIRKVLVACPLYVKLPREKKGEKEEFWWRA